MANLKRLKRRVLQQAVQENLDLLNGSSRRRRKRRQRILFLRHALLAALPLAVLAASTYVLSTMASNSDEVMVVTQVLEVPETNTGPGNETAEPVSLPAPGRIEPSVLSLGVHKVVLDPGHGGFNSGTVAPGGLQEKDLTLDISLRLKKLLEEQNLEVLMTRDTDVSVDLEERTRFANDHRADIFVSIHVNWLEAREVRGVETFFLGATDDPYLNRIAAAENSDSNYSLADFRTLVESLYTGIRQDESRQLARAVQGDLFAALRTVTPKLRNRGVKTAPFVVLVSSEMPAILVEVSCLSNEEEARQLAKPYYRQFIAEALANGIRSYATSLEPDDLQPPKEET
ncbi:MAG: N-acetylmuramoyl-L-alanine amidase [Deltaproteobacteria bacterium]|nr:N-acetylmuramoyl-L-alanine amidase [Deltaproteobacteria bacterium]